MGNTTKKTSTAMLAVIALLGWFALIMQLYINVNLKLNPLPEIIIRYFSYFTINTNLVVAVCCTFLLLFPGSAAGNFFGRQSTLTAITIYILIVGVVYNIILRQLWKPTGMQQLVDELLHLIIPVLFFLYWIFTVAKNELKWNHALSWMLYPAIYGAFVLVRGYASGFYPYPFIDMAQLGFTKTIINVIGFVFVFLLAGLLFIWMGKKMSSKVSR